MNQKSMEVESPAGPWWLVLLWGIAAIITGILLFTRTATTTLVLVQFLGIYWLITGIFSIIALFWDRTDWGWKLFNAILGIIAGILIIGNPLWSTLLVPTTLAIVIGITGIIIGAIQLFQAFRGGGWGIGILGVLSILLGIMLISRPVIAGLAIALVLGILLVLGGILAIIASFSLRNLERQAKAVPVQPASRASNADAVPEVEDVQESAGEAVVEDAVVVEEVAEEAASAGSSETEMAAEAMTSVVEISDPSEEAKFKHPLEYVEGIGPAYGEQLKSIGLVTCLDLLNAGATRKGREEIAEKSGISGKLILKWVNHVDLYRIKGVGSEYADLLEAAGVDTVVELAQRNPGNLFDKVSEVNAEKDLVRKLPTAAQVEDWVGQAKDLPRVVSY